jgi:hypothetical protein
MANTFLNATATLTDATETTIGTVPSARTWVLLGCNLANTSNSQISVDVKVASTYVIKGAPIPAGSALSILDGKIIAEATETVTVTSASSSGDVDVVLSYMEQS